MGTAPQSVPVHDRWYKLSTSHWSLATGRPPFATVPESRQNPSMPAAFDAIAAVRRLEDAGLSREAAEAITASDLEASGAGRGGLAIKADLAALEARLTNRLYAVAGAIVGAVFASAAALAVAILQAIPNP